MIVQREYHPIGIHQTANGGSPFSGGEGGTYDGNLLEHIFHQLKIILALGQVEPQSYGSYGSAIVKRG
jgi:hypothetical protein